MTSADDSLTCGDKLRSLGQFIYNHERKEVLGRDGERWGKVAVFYFFFYVGLAGFFCAMLAVFMAVSPKDHPRYYTTSSRMQTRSNPVSPGLGFRPQPYTDNYLIGIDLKDTEINSKWNPQLYTKSLKQYLTVTHSQNRNKTKNNAMSGYQSHEGYSTPFNIDTPGDCTPEKNYGYNDGKPCVLVKMNKIVNWIPEVGRTNEDNKEGKDPCPGPAEGIQINCHGEYPADQDSIGNLTYHSEGDKEGNSNCGTIRISQRFPYRGKSNRLDIYHQPYIWVQFLTPKPNVLINVLCRAYGANIYYDKKQLRGLTRFQIYIKTLSTDKTSL
ncbi:unnamed protein product [Didymodactylos carnosus]|uniref:Sodium/potassium-transporting ATPase subunit beta-2 n=1 Tax=Didymodactylos carnosus TaxID=1234261 RepID=A0A814B8N4_9BILA|nr:unnamed protein product [Didymodactylos carnosus]CAF3704422.1 unnamed protein product [Didymodactylos carnosus]